MAKVFTLAEISEHNTTNDCWVTISGKVYNLSSFMDEHPGGDEVLLAATGKDATAEFEDVGHSQDARELMEKYYIGEINKSTIINDEPIPTFEPKVEKKGTKSKYMTYFLQFVVPLIILNLVIAFFSKSSS